MSAPLPEERRSLAAGARRLAASGMVAGTAGNLSIRSGDLVAVTPSGVPYEDVTEENCPVLALEDASPVYAPMNPTSETPMHLAVYARVPEISAIVHTHSPAAGAVGLLVDELPAIHYYVGLFGGTTIRVAPYARFGSQALADGVAAALDGRLGCILAHHGALTGAATLDEAFTLAEHLEWLCDVWLRASAIGEPRLLSDEQIAESNAAFGTYGQG